MSQVLNINKLKLRTVSAALTGTVSFKRFFFVIGDTDNPADNTGIEDDETAVHSINFSNYLT